MNTRNLFFSVSSDAGSFTAVVPWEEGFGEAMAKRLARLKGLEGEDADLNGLTFDADVELYDATEELDNWIEDNDSVCKYVNDGYVALEGEPPLDESRRVRLSVRELSLSRYGNFYWTVLPKHWSETLETQSLEVGEDPFA